MACVCGVRVRTWRALADMARGVVGADVPAARVPVGVPDGVPDVVPWVSRGEKWMGAVRFRFMKRGRFAIMESDQETQWA